MKRCLSLLLLLAMVLTLGACGRKGASVTLPPRIDGPDAQKQGSSSSEAPEIRPSVYATLLSDSAMHGSHTISRWEFDDTGRMLRYAREDPDRSPVSVEFHFDGPGLPTEAVLTKNGETHTYVPILDEYGWLSGAESTDGGPLRLEFGYTNDGYMIHEVCCKDGEEVYREDLVLEDDGSLKQRDIYQNGRLYSHDEYVRRDGEIVIHINSKEDTKGSIEDWYGGSISHYNSHGDVELVEHFYKEESNITSTDQFYFVYDENGHATLEEYWSSEELQYVTQRTFDENGRKIREEITSEGEPEYAESFTYNDQGKLIRKETFGRGNEPLNVFEYDYDDQGQKILSVSYLAGETAEQSRTEYTYDEWGNQLTEVEYRDGALRSSRTNEYLPLYLSTEEKLLYDQLRRFYFYLTQYA